MQRIFVQIASYRDPECHHTLAELFAKATHPERVFAGVCWQYDPEEDADMIAVPYPRADQVRVVQYHVRDARGAGWARNEAQTLWAGEEYVLQIQAHMRFEPGWDDTLIQLLEGLPTEKAVLTAWLPGYTPPDNRPPLAGQFPMATLNRLGDAHDAQVVHMIKRMVPQESVKAPFLTAMWVGNFFFARADVFKEVPSDPHIYFWGEELNYSARLWTHGYDIYHLDRVVLYHYWDRKGVKDGSNYRDHHSDRNRKSLARNLHVLGIETTEDAAALEDIEHYGLGKMRSIEAYFSFIGVDVRHGVIAHHARLGEFSAVARPKIFVAIASYRDPETSPTIEDLFAKAAHPERVFVGVCQQWNAVEDADCLLQPSRPKQVRVKQVDAGESLGANWARAEAHALHQGEEYILQIDGHMRFEPGWDEALIAMHTRSPSEKAVISAYLPNYTPPDTKDLSPGHILRMGVRGLGKEEDTQIVHLTGHFVPMNSPRARLARSPFIIANFLFAPASIWRQVPVDPHIYFYGDEISLSARLWTHGIDVYQPDAVVAYHYWARHDQLAKHPYRRPGQPQAEVTRKRIQHLLGIKKTTSKTALQNLENYGLGAARSLTDFWEYAGINLDTRQVSEAAHKGAWDNIRQKEDTRIFVRIASYRDSECQWTVKDLFEKAAHPDHITVGICWQYDAKEDAHCFEQITRPDQVRMVSCDWRESDGVSWARAQTERLWQGEPYTLQIDAHMRFVPGWDELLIAELALCPSAKPVLSCSPAQYTPPDHLDPDPRPTVRRVLPFSAQGNIRGRGEMLDVEPDAPLPGAFVAAGFMFSRSEILQEVPYDPYLYFDQEEIMMALRLYTHGWDVFSTCKSYLYHYYHTLDQLGHPLHWQDFGKANPAKLKFLSTRGLARLNHLTGYKISTDSRTLVDIENYGLGAVRSLADFEAFSGIDFTRKIAHPKALQCGFIPNLSRWRHSPFIPDDRGGTMQKSVREAYAEGDILPYFIATDHTGNHFPIEKSAGRPSLLFFLPFADPAGNAPFFRALHEAMREAGKLDCSLFFVMDAPVPALAQFKEATRLPYVFWADPHRQLSHALGIASLPCGFLLGPNVQIKKKYSDTPPEQLARQAVLDMAAFQKANQSAAENGSIIRNVAPVLILPDVFSPQLCDQLIAAFHAGETFQGEVGDKGYVPTSKVREDFIVPQELRTQIDLKLSRSLFPEIEKIFGFPVAGRENYKIGRYSDVDGGFFARHRDNFIEMLAYRRVAMTLHLSDDYEGGGLRFPEYDSRIYRPSRGSIIAFSSSIAHEALKVTKGNRYILLGFFHGEEEERYRQHYVQSKGESVDAQAFIPARQDLGGLDQSRDFFRKWKK